MRIGSHCGDRCLGGSAGTRSQAGQLRDLMGHGLKLPDGPTKLDPLPGVAHRRVQHCIQGTGELDRAGERTKSAQVARGAWRNFGKR